MENSQEKTENKIIDWIALESDGRLVAFKPQKGADLAVQKKGDYPGKELFFNIKMFEIPSKENNFEMDIPPEDFKNANTENFYFLFVVFNEVMQKVDEKIWMVPITDLKSLGLVKLKSKEFFKYQMNKTEFINFLVDKLILKNKPETKKGFKIKTY